MARTGLVGTVGIVVACLVFPAFRLQEVDARIGAFELQEVESDTRGSEPSTGRRDHGVSESVYVVESASREFVTAHGRVFSGSPVAPIAGASIVARLDDGEELGRATSDADGSFELSIPKSRLRDCVLVRFVASAENRHDSLLERIRIGQGFDFEHLYFALEAGVRITGRAIDQDGRPIAGAVAFVAPLAGENEFTPHGGRRSSGTDGDGQFQLSGFKVGVHRITVVCDRLGVGETTVEINERGVHTHEIGDVVLTAPGKTTLSGQILYPDGVPVVEQRIELFLASIAPDEPMTIAQWRDAHPRSAQSGRRCVAVQTNSEGIFSASDMTPGMYVFWIGSRDGVEDHRSPVTVDSGSFQVFRVEIHHLWARVVSAAPDSWHYFSLLRRRLERGTELVFPKSRGTWVRFSVLPNAEYWLHARPMPIHFDARTYESMRTNFFFQWSPRHQLRWIDQHVNVGPRDWRTIESCAYVAMQSSSVTVVNVSEDARINMVRFFTLPALTPVRKMHGGGGDETLTTELPIGDYLIAVRMGERNMLKKVTIGIDAFVEVPFESSKDALLRLGW